MTTRAAIIEADLNRAAAVAVKHGMRVRIVGGGNGERAEIILEPVDTKKAPEEW